MEMQKLEFLRHLRLFRRHVYLDHNATTPVSRRVRRTMNRVLKHGYGNPSSLYGIGRKLGRDHGGGPAAGRRRHSRRSR